MNKNMIYEKPFYRTKLDEERAEEKRRTFTVSINQDEENWLLEGRQILNIDSESRTLKELAKVGLNVLQTTFSTDFFKYLTSEKRKRLGDGKLRKV